MVHEEKKTNSEQSTKSHGKSFGMVHGPSYSSGVNNSGSSKGFKTQGIQTTGDVTSSYKNMSVQSAFVPVGYTNHTSVLNNGLIDNLKLGEKRKLQSLTSEDLVSGLNDREEKRFKSDAPQSVYKNNGSFNELRKPFYFGEKSIYCNPSFRHSTLNGSNGISKDISRKLDFNSNALSDDMLKHLFTSKPKKARMDYEEMRTSSLQTTPVDLKNNLTRVGEAESTRHGEICGASFSKNTQEKKSVEANFASGSREFISLDSTKSSFLTQIKKLRENAEFHAITCPFCGQSFSKYPDLKHHVQTHKYANISGDRNLFENQSPVSFNGNSMSTPVSSRAVHSPSPRRVNTGDEAVVRASSVIHFAEKKNKESAEK